MEGPGPTLVVVGALLVAGLLADWTHRHLPVPRVSALILLGVAVGPVGLDLVPDEREQWFPVVAALALTMVGLLIGGDFSVDRLRDVGGSLVLTATGQGVGAAVLVGAGLLLAGVGTTVALPLAGIAMATAPAAIAAVVHDTGGEGPLPRTLLGVAAAADALAVVAFSVVMVAVGLLTPETDVSDAVGAAAWEIGGAVLVGLALGVPGAFLTGRLQQGRPLLEEAVGLVLLCAGLCLWLDTSYLLASVVTGAVIANGARHHERTLREIEGIEWPFLVVFFLLAGAGLELDALSEAGLVTAVYVALRTAGKVAGGYAGCRLAGTGPTTARWLGAALLPQAGVAVGLALLAEERLPSAGADLLAVVIASTVVFELVGPFLTRAAIRRASAEQQPSGAAR